MPFHQKKSAASIFDLPTSHLISCVGYIIMGMLYKNGPNDVTQYLYSISVK